MKALLTSLHIPVLLDEVIDSFANLKSRNDLVYFDGTYGRGGHFRKIVEVFKPSKCFLTDQDEEAITVAQLEWKNEISERKINCFRANFSDFADRLWSEEDVVLAQQTFDMILLDLGVSSPQLDQSERGFSFTKDGPLDMRMDRRQSQTAAELINNFTAEELLEIFKSYGEVFHASRVVKAIVADRLQKPFTSTLQLAQLIERIDGWQKKGFHPATQYFMALRLAVNSELQVVESALPKLIGKLNDGGRISVISFHSLEDRLVKNIFKESPEGFLVNKKVVVASEEECKKNPRSRSAKLRTFQKGPRPPKEDKFAIRRAQLKS